MKLGIIGYPLSGKTTLFSLLTGIYEPSKLYTGAAPYHVGTMHIADARLDWIHQMAAVPRKVNISVEIIDFAALREGILKESEYIAQLRLMDGFLHLIKAFDESENNAAKKIHEAMADIDMQFILSDLESAQNRIEKIKAKLKKLKEKNLEEELIIIEKCHQWLSQEKPLRDLAIKHDEERMLRGFGLFSQKPILHIINISDKNLSNQEFLSHLTIPPHSKKVSCIICCVKLEKELTELSAEDALVFAEEWGIKKWGKESIALPAFSLMGMITFFTIGKDEVKAWHVIEGTTAHKAAGAIHTDFEKGFIKAEVISYEELKKLGNMAHAKKTGSLRYEGKDYIVKDGDIITFKFNL